MNKVKTVIVGAGAISDIFIDNMIHKFSILDVCGIASKTGIRAKEKAEKYGIAHFTVKDILEDETIELVVNITPPDTHYELIKSFLEAGKNVYTEKPLATDIKKATELVNLAEKKHLYLGSSPDTFLGSAIQTAQNAVESGMIGRVTSAVAVDNRDMGILSEYLPWTNTKGGAMGIDLGVYYMTALINILGSVKEVCGISRINQVNRKHSMVKMGNYGELFQMVADTITAGTLLFEGGVVASFHMDGDSIFPEKPYLTIYGTDGILYMPDPNDFGGEVKVLLKGNNEPVLLPQKHGLSENSRGTGVAEMAWSMRKGRVSRAGKELSYHCLEALLGILESSETKQVYNMKSSYTKQPQLPTGYCGKLYLGVDEEGALAE